jgi:hypothetical protein
MTGFIFTCSLLCTAALQTDPGVLQRTDASVMRQILEIVIPALPVRVPLPVRKCCGAAQMHVSFRTDVSADGSSRHVSPAMPGCATGKQIVRMNPIRAPSCAQLQCP